MDGSMSQSLDVFDRFIADPEAWDMFITGQAGTGKTTNLDELTSYCEANKIPYAVCAHTHKACGVLRSKLSTGAPVSTLWSFLKKRPSINTSAKKVHEVDSSFQHGDPDKTGILFIDEYSVVGEKDLMDIRAMQDPQYEADPHVKIVWIGDPNQLPPVKDQQTLIAYGEYQVKLKKIWRTDGPLIGILTKLVSFIEGAPAEPLEENSMFKRGVNILEAYEKQTEDKVMLAYTNAQVQHLNFSIMGRSEPHPFDMLFSPSLHDEFTFLQKISPQAVAIVDQAYGDSLGFNSKFKTLEFMLQHEICDFMLVADAEGDEFIYPVIFGTSNYKLAKDRAASDAVKLNKEIETKFKTTSAAVWAKNNYQHPLARKRALAWRTYMTLNDTVYGFDFNHAMTVHKSQGSTFKHVYLDSQDLAICMDRNYQMYLRLFYVAISRASHSVTTN